MKETIVCIAFYIEGTGLTRVMDTLVNLLKTTYSVHYVGVGYSGSLIEQDDLTIYPTNQNGGDVMGAYFARELIERLEPRCVFILQDIWHFNRYTEVFRSVRHLTKLIGYTPLDGEVADPESVRGLLDLDVLVLYTDWAREQIQSAMLLMVDETQLPNIEVVPHGVELSSFYLLSDKQTCKNEVFPELGADAFVFLNASRPCIRKRVDLTIRAFAAFAQGKPDGVKLCLHHAISELESESLVALIKELEVEDRVILNPLNKDKSVLSDADLNKLYNACDVGVNSSMGEGWGLVSFEHAATGASQIVPRHTACQSLWEDVGVVVDVEPSQVGQISPFVMTQPCLGDLTKAFEELYTDKTYREKIASQCFVRATNQKFSWRSIAQKWQSIFASV